MAVRNFAFALLLTVIPACAETSSTQPPIVKLDVPAEFQHSLAITVSIRTADDRWKAMWAILSGRGLKQPIAYGVTPPGFTTMIQPQKLIPGRVYAGFATDGHGGSSKVTFGFDKDGTMIFPDSLD
jgi:hypothetical protein